MAGNRGHDGDDGSAAQEGFMTTIAWDGKLLAADTLATGANGLRRTVNKLRDCGGYWFGGAGPIDVLVIVAEWLSGGAKPELRPKLEDDGCHGFAIEKATGRAFLVEGKTPVLERIYDPFHATGSGRDFAIAAMALGKNAEQAVRFASQFDCFTGPDVDVVDLVSTPEDERTFQEEHGRAMREATE